MEWFVQTPEQDDFTLRIYRMAGGLPETAPIHKWLVGSAVSRPIAKNSLSPVIVWAQNDSRKFIAVSMMA